MSDGTRPRGEGTRLLFTGLAVGFVLTPLREWVRPVYGTADHGALAWVLGWTPNAVAGVALTLMGTGALSAWVGLRRSVVAGVAVATFLGLAGWELHQRGPGNLRFDADDLWATGLGCLVGAALAVRLSRRAGVA